MTEELNGSHQPWDELVAAHALDALEPSEEQRLLAHLDACSECRRRLDEFNLVAAQLGSLADDEGDPPSWEHVRPHLISGPASPAPKTRLAAVRPLHRRINHRTLTAVAAAVVIAGGIAAGWQLTRPGPANPAPVALAACRQQSGCRIIQLHGQSGDNAAVLVQAGHASLVPVKLPAPPTGRMYVLWQLPRDGGPIHVVAFRNSSRQTPSVPLVAGYGDTAAFAVSLEPAGPMPTRPTDVVALGAAGS